MSKIIHFDCGLPRSGTTLLSALLNQHPDVYTAPQSPLPLVLYTAHDILYNHPGILYKDEKSADNLLSCIVSNYYKDVKESVVIDKSRLWPNNISKIKKYITKDPKFICCVRDPLEILASFMILLDKNKDTNYIDIELSHRGLGHTNENRCNLLMSDLGTLYEAISALKRALLGGYHNMFMLIDYNDLVSNTQDKLNQILSFLSLDPFTFNLDKISARFHEDSFLDTGINNLHKIRTSVSKSDTNYRDVLGDNIIRRYKDLDFWRDML